MKTIISILIISSFTLIVNAQIGTANVIDASLETAGISKIESSDLNNDGLKDLITSTTGNLGRVGYYQNLNNNSFSSFNLIESFAFCRGLAVGDFNNDTWKDIVSIGGINNDARIHLNNAGTFGPSEALDSNLETILNDVVVADFDQNNSDDIVIIGQHSIDFYRNDGSGNFTKEVILTTSTSPLPLECLDIEAKDMDNDGDIDLVSGETAGLVIYTNNGNGVFTPHYYSIIPEIYFLIHAFDMDNDGDLDVVGKNSAGAVKWFSNNGNGLMTYEATLTNLPNLLSINSTDFNNDGLEDLYVSYPNNVSIFENDSSQTFSIETTVHQADNLLMGAIQIANIDNLGLMDYVWAGGTNTLAFNLNEFVLSIDEVNSNPLLIYPNPTLGLVNFSKPVNKVMVYNLLGEKILETTRVNYIDLSSYSSGIYMLVLGNDNNFLYQKVIKK